MLPDFPQEVVKGCEKVTGKREMNIFPLSTNPLLMANVMDRLLAWRSWLWKPWVNRRCDLGDPLVATGGRRNFWRPSGKVLVEELKCFAGSQYPAAV